MQQEQQGQEVQERYAEPVNTLEQQELVRQKNREIGKLKQLLRIREEEITTLQRYRSEFLESLSHELRTPLNSILILSEVFRENRGGHLNETQQELTDTIHKAGIVLSELVTEALDFAALEVNRVIVYPENLVLQELATAIEQTFRSEFEQKGLRFSVELAEHLPASLYTDRERLWQILKNCLRNALKFTEKGRVSVSIHQPEDEIDFSISRLHPTQTIAISITDSGIGIASEKQSLIFEAFRQLEGGLTRQYEGAGLGLAVAERSTRLLGGEIQVVSEEGQGSTFSIYLPETFGASHIYPSAAASEISATTIEAHTLELERQLAEIANIRDDRHAITPQDSTALIIEDDPIAAKTLFEYARKSRMKCLIAGDGEAGLHLASHYNPQVIFLHAGLSSRLNSWKVMERLKDNFETRHVPVLFTSFQDISRDVMKIGALGDVPKPLETEILERVFQRLHIVLSNARRTVLVAERTEDITGKMRDWLPEGQVRIVTAKHERDLVNVLNADDINCVVVNIDKIPEHGLTFLNSLANNAQAERLPVIVYSENVFSQIHKLCVKVFENTFIVKSAYTQERLLAEVSLFLHLAKDALPADSQYMLEVLHPEQISLEGKQILLADNDMRNVFLLSGALEERGAEVIVVESAEEALKYLWAFPRIDLLLLDVMLPTLDEYAFLNRIRRQQQFERLPVIIMKADGVRGDRRRYINIGATEYVSKPIENNRLLSLLRVWLY